MAFASELANLLDAEAVSLQSVVFLCGQRRFEHAKFVLTAMIARLDEFRQFVAEETDLSPVLKELVNWFQYECSRLDEHIAKVTHCANCLWHGCLETTIGDIVWNMKRFKVDPADICQTELELKKRLGTISKHCNSFENLEKLKSAARLFESQSDYYEALAQELLDDPKIETKLQNKTQKFARAARKSFNFIRIRDGTATFGELPNELVVTILSFVPPNDLINCASTCKRIRSLVLGNGQRMQRGTIHRLEISKDEKDNLRIELTMDVFSFTIHVHRVLRRDDGKIWLIDNDSGCCQIYPDMTEALTDHFTKLVRFLNPVHLSLIRLSFFELATIRQVISTIPNFQVTKQLNIRLAKDCYLKNVTKFLCESDIYKFQIVIKSEFKEAADQYLNFLLRQRESENIKARKSIVVSAQLVDLPNVGQPDEKDEFSFEAEHLNEPSAYAVFWMEKAFCRRGELVGAHMLPITDVVDFWTKHQSYHESEKVAERIPTKMIVTERMTLCVVTRHSTPSLEEQYREKNVDSGRLVIYTVADSNFVHMLDMSTFFFGLNGLCLPSLLRNGFQPRYLDNSW